MGIISPSNVHSITFNTREKYFPLAKMRKITVASKPIFKCRGWEETKKEKLHKPQTKGTKSRTDSIHRAVNKIYEISMLNDFTYFITWTLDASIISRTNAQEVSKKLKKFLNNIQQRNNAKYLIVPEYHADKQSIHIHGLISGDFNLIDSGKHTKDNKIIYNMYNWKYGYSTAIELTGIKQIYSSYITKYISKDFNKIFGHFYYAGGNIIREADTFLYDSDYSELDAPEYYVEVANISFKYQDLKEKC